jgi:hypothetical protein
MWSFFMIMVDKFSDGRLEMPFAEQHHAVHALGLRRLDEPFGVTKRARLPSSRVPHLRRVIGPESEALDERLHALFLTTARKSLGSREFRDAMQACAC